MADRDAKGRYLPAHKIAGPGRQPIYDEAHNELVYRLALLGLTEKQMSEVIGIQQCTFEIWKATHPAFSERLQEGRIAADANVAHGLYRRASGMIVRERREERGIDENGNLMPTKTVDVTKEIPPDTNAAMHWLGIREHSRARWGRKIGVDDDDDADKALADMSDDDLEARKAKIEARLKESGGE